jgi:membrane protein implicated in regulation of membrane protease activity
MELQWWIWLVLGFGLILLELVLPTFFIIWFGIGAVAVGVIAGVWPGLSLASELIIWVVLSSLTVALWFKVFKPRQVDKRWTADDVIGEVGLLVAPVSEFQKGRVRFQKPILGNEEWTCIANADIATGERVRILAIEGNTVRVGKA